MSEETIVAPLPWGREVIEGFCPIAIRSCG